MKGHQPKPDRVQVLPLRDISAAPENDQIYRAVSVHDVRDLVRSIRQHGVQEPLLVSTDGFVISGHRRRLAAQLAGLSEVPVRIHPVSRRGNHEAFVKLLVEMNTQRIKGADVLLHEAVIKINPELAHQQIIKDRERKDEERNQESTLSEIYADDGRRDRLSDAKLPLLNAIKDVINRQRDYWPLSVRQIHYRLLGEGAPLIHASKPGSQYENDLKSYRAAVDVAARARVQGLLPWRAIEDETRPVDLNSAFQNLSEFIQQQTGDFLIGYWRDLMQSQPHHIEIVAEKLTVRTILQKVARAHTIPMTIGRGMCSLPAKNQIANRYYGSGKDKLILLIVSDLDPAGDAIAADLLKSFRRDFGIDGIEAYKAALNIGQVREYALEPSMDAKASSPTYQTFVDRYGITDAYELEALEPADLADILTNAIEEMIDRTLFNQELQAEERDSAKLLAIREQTAKFFENLRL